MEKVKVKMTEYALYKGDDLLYMGTAAELAEKHGVKEETILYYATPTHHRRIKHARPSGCTVVVRLECDVDE